MKKTLYLAFLAFLVPSLGFAAQKDKVTEGIYDMGGRKLIDRSVEVTGALQVDKWLELINESTPTTPASTHARFFYNNGQQKLCVVFGDGSQTCLGPGTSGGGGILAGATAPVIYNSTTNVISFSQTVGQNETFTSSVTFTTATLTTSYADFTGIADPVQPGAGIVRLHAITNNGISRLEQDDSVGNTDVILGQDTVFIARNNSLGNLLPLQVVDVNGATGNIPQIGLAFATATVYMPAVAVIVDSITNNSYGEVMKTGIINHVNTNSYNVGDILYVSATSSGSLTNVRPVYPNYIQQVGVVLVKGVGNGSILVNIPSSYKGNESGTTSDSFQIGNSTNPAIILNDTTNGSTFPSSVTVQGTFQANVSSAPSYYVSASFNTIPKNTVDIGSNGSAAHILYTDQITLGTGTAHFSLIGNNIAADSSYNVPPIPGSANAILQTDGSTNMSWTNGPTFTSSTTVNSPAGFYTNYGASLGSATLRNVASGTQCLHADASGNVTGTGSDCNAGAGTLTSTQTWTGTNTFANAVVITSNSVVTSSTNACGYLIGTTVQISSFSVETSSATSQATFVPTTLTKSITPKCATDVISINATGGVFASSAGRACEATIERGTTNLAGALGLCVSSASGGGTAATPCGMFLIDNPATTSATTYTVYIKLDSATGQCVWGNGNFTQLMTLQEIAR